MFVDIHSHILPGLDDGAQTLPEAIEMVRRARLEGTVEMVATPHANRVSAYDRTKTFETADELDYESGSPVRIHTGCELFLDANWIAKAIADPSQFTIGSTSYILVEFGEWLPGDPVQIFRALRSAGLRPILAHPERQPMLSNRPSTLAAFIREGVLIQVTAGSILKGKVADDLMQRGLVHFVASDTHNLTTRPPSLREAYETVRDAYGEPYADQLFIANPAAIVRGEELGDQLRPEAPHKRTWWKFGGYRPSASMTTIPATMIATVGIRENETSANETMPTLPASAEDTTPASRAMGQAV